MQADMYGTGTLSQWNNIERGRQIPNVLTITRMAAAIGVEVGKIFTIEMKMRMKSND